MVTCGVIMMAVGAYMSLTLGGDGFVTVTASVERLYLLFLGDFDVMYGRMSEVSGGVDRFIFLLIFLSLTVVITVIAFNILLSIVIDSYSKAKDMIEARQGHFHSHPHHDDVVKEEQQQVEGEQQQAEEDYNNSSDEEGGFYQDSSGMWHSK